MALQSKCSVTGCTDKVHGNGLCTKHYNRIRRHGSVEQTRPQDWGNREKHPLYTVWWSLRRYPTVQMCDEWKNDFWLFVSDVGDRPSKDVFLKKIDPTKPLTKNNAFWRSRHFKYENLENDGRQKYARAYRKLHPELFQRRDAMRKYGITGVQYNDLFEKQNHLCAICNKPESSVDGRTKKVRRLAIDHCHVTGKVRGLLCSSCNHGLGRFKDDIELLKKAIYYLTQHRKESDFESSE